MSKSSNRLHLRSSTSLSLPGPLLVLDLSIFSDRPSKVPALPLDTHINPTINLSGDNGSLSINSPKDLTRSQSTHLRRTIMPVAVITVDAILFDMDGTLIDSTPGVFKAWETFARDYNLEDSAEIAHATHGRRLYDTLKEYCHINEESKLKTEIDRFEDEVIQGGPTLLPGAIALIEQLRPETSHRWTIVTSASDNYAPRALSRAGIPLPRAGLVTSNDVSHGKPHPAPYLAGAQKCGVDPAKCLVVEDAISGLKSGRSAGAQTLAVCTSTTRETILKSGADPHYLVNDLTKVSAQSVDGKIEVTIYD
ncbi:Sugar phosphatase YfbT [Hypsizygus marmoreus]|uniref:Sugar phosphatase YfbT n=1 Tax=Hypsizygus marmoreus TaxID=39966 RepID=A0A369KBL2_HYPMA|nr:Sugar phosphatase YfbT [Hypsizygus marmoreus]